MAKNNKTAKESAPAEGVEIAIIYETEIGYWIVDENKEAGYPGIESQKINYIKQQKNIDPVEDPGSLVVIGGANGHRLNTNGKNAGGKKKYITFVKLNTDKIYITSNADLTEVLRVYAGFNADALSTPFFKALNK